MYDLGLIPAGHHCTPLMTVLTGNIAPLNTMYSLFSQFVKYIYRLGYSLVKVA